MKALLFASDGISFMANNDQTLEINGKGQLMGFIIHSNTEKALSNGDHYINLRPPYKEGDIAVGFYTMNWDEGNGVVFYEKTIGPALLAGKANVLQKQDIISFSFTDENRNILKGVYNGSIQKKSRL